jgi:hypothetical protein
MEYPLYRMCSKHLIGIEASRLDLRVIAAQFCHSLQNKNGSPEGKPMIYCLRGPDAFERDGCRFDGAVAEAGFADPIPVVGGSA